ncbi:endochitinase 1 [Aspergillus nomiae NRRL 13137]|uniref:chitinase n=1 Tax=Aspergillus nomiae NRRL (strain ATCC 15546 / NRRL 13137 / CBS 260.88 / M93) TaxID=1509407 RepID=A0A0L1J821_ASPN3|nr:endochitinase 1 [Aspergillus nomiae NRRL 13137]KNG87558.1 endochitinase 1 [Aspergillus nomiae NRRL 13137]
MRNFFLLLGGLACLTSAALIPHSNDKHHTPSRSEPENGYVSMAYFASWAIYRDHYPQHIPVDKLTHVLYAFANITKTGEVRLWDPWADYDKHFPGDPQEAEKDNFYGCVKQLGLLKRKNKHLKVLLSIGGYTNSNTTWAGILKVEANRKTFAQTAVELMHNVGFDGLDIDWEYPKEESAKDMVSLLKEVREELDSCSKQHANGKKFLLTIACSAGPSNYKALQMSEMDKYLDLWNLMAYDYVGSWANATGHAANLYGNSSNPETTPANTDDAIKYYTSNGVPSNKIVLGMPLYGRAFVNTTGPGQPYVDVGTGMGDPGVWHYKVLPLANATVVELPDLGASYSYDEKNKMYVSYDTVKTTIAKADYIKKQGLAGGMWWETSMDKVGETSLISTLVRELGGTDALEKSENYVNYTWSKYANVRDGFKADLET